MSIEYKNMQKMFGMKSLKSNKQGRDNKKKLNQWIEKFNYKKEWNMEI